ncbi:hypothetical protein B0H16DRAFT_1876754 [Mycena metata]|uniref:Uncharacterized protein n=1 Tax=Mycena metata TaxID=1033252 RepID=A0AAD7P1S2_9AGAR|nr:hypothetical protein B0H16DRAFT_1876754 [Mycena metata]
MAEIDAMIGGSEDDIRYNLDVVRKVLYSVYPPAIIHCDIISAELELRKGNRIFAWAAFQENLKVALGSNSEVVCFCLERLANTRRWGVVDSNWPAVYLAFAHHSRDKLSLCKAYLFLGDQFSSSMDEETARNLYTVALEGFTSLDVHYSRAHCMLRLGDIVNMRGDKSKAAELWGAARPLFERSSQADVLVELDTRLPAKNIGY